MDSFVEVTDRFLKSLGTLGDGCLPLVVAMRQTAQTLDTSGVSAALVNQYRLAYLALAEQTGTEEVEIDPLEALLS